MNDPYILGPTQPNTQIYVPEGRAIGGFAIGILVLDLWYPLIPGNVANACSFNFPVLYKILKGAGIEILNADPAILNKVIEGGNELVEQGVRAIIGSCGYFGFYQKEAARALNVPVFLSSLLQVPIIVQSLKPKQKVGILCAVDDSLTPKILNSCGIKDESRIVIVGAQDLPEFQNILKCKGNFNSNKLETQLVDLSKQLVKDNPQVAAILLECSDMPPYARAIQNAVKLPIFDFITLIYWVYNAVVRQSFVGII